MRFLLLCALLSAQIQLGGQAGSVSVALDPGRPQPQTVVLEARNSDDESWRCLSLWNLGKDRPAQLETLPGQPLFSQYRVLTFDENGQPRIEQVSYPAGACR